MPSSVSRAPPLTVADNFEPERTKAALVIQHRLMGERQYQAVLALVEKYLHKFDLVNMVCAMHMCAVTARDHELLTRQILSDPNFVNLFHTTKQTILQDVKKVAPRTSSDILWSCARLSVFDSDLFSAIIADATTRLEYFPAHGIGNLVFALGYIGQRPRASFMQALEREMKARINIDFEPQTVSMVVYGLMRLGIRDDRLMKIISEHITRTQLEGFQPLSVSCIAFAYAKLEYWDAEAFSLMGKRLVERIQDLEPRQIVMNALSFARSVGAIEESGYTIDRMTTAVLSRLDEFDNREFATFCFAIGKYKQLSQPVNLLAGKMPQVFTDPDRPDPIAKEFIEQVQRRNPVPLAWDMEMSEANLITYSLMRLKHRDEEFLEAAAVNFARNAPELQPVELINALYAFARLDFLHLEFVNAMVEEIRRRQLIRSPEMSAEGLATIVYSLALCRVREDDLMSEVAALMCERGFRDATGQQMAMLLWAMTVTGCRKNAEPVVSAILEELARNIDRWEPLSIGIVLWASAILAGPSAGLRILEVLFTQRFWTRTFNEAGYTMIYHALASLKAEEGLETRDLSCWPTCRQTYEVNTATFVSSQNLRLSERLKMQGIAHEVNAMVPALEGFPEAGVRADIVIQKLKLVIEVEGPQRMTMPLDKLLDKLAESSSSKRSSEDEKALKDLSGRPHDVLADARTLIECGLTGPASFKRRLLRKCGWHVVTVSFDENEEYIADALNKMGKPKAEAEVSQGEGGAAGVDQEQGAESASSMGPDEVGQSAAESLMEGSMGGGITISGETLDVEESAVSPGERRLRERTSEALKELRRRIAQERGDAAASNKYASHLEYRQWQVRLERQVFREMVASL